MGRGPEVDRLTDTVNSSEMLEGGADRGQARPLSLDWPRSLDSEGHAPEMSPP